MLLSESCVQAKRHFKQGLLVQDHEQTLERVLDIKVLLCTCCCNDTSCGSRREDLLRLMSLMTNGYLIGYLSLIGPHSWESLAVLILLKYNPMASLCMARCITLRGNLSPVCIANRCWHCRQAFSSAQHMPVTASMSERTSQSMAR